MKKNIRKLICAGLAAAMVLSLAACSGASEEAPAPAPAKTEEAAPAAEAEEAAPAAEAAGKEGKTLGTDTIKAAFVCSDIGTENAQKWLKGCQEACAQYENVEFTEFDCKNDVTTQNQIIDECITQGFDVMVVHPVDSSAIADGVTRAEEAGINVGTVNLKVDCVYTEHVGFPNYEAGIPVAEAVAEAIGGKGNVCLINAPVALAALIEMDDAMKDTFAEKYPDVKLIDDQPGDWSVESGDQLTRDFVTKYGKDGIQAIIAINDSMALGAAQALDASGIEGVVITGGDGTDDALRAVKDGKMFLTQLQPSVDIAKTCMEDLIAKRCEGYVGTTADATPEVIKDMVIITAENVDEYLPQ